MADKSKIEWTDATWNPVTGCDRVSEGCDNCYALTLASRLKEMGNPRYQTDGRRATSGPGFGVALHEDALVTPLSWKRPRMIFVNSMSDLFHPDVPATFIARCVEVMVKAEQHTFQVLTKRPRRMAALMPKIWSLLDVVIENPPKNIWLGVSVENQKSADARIPLLLETPAGVRFLSCEPLLGSIDLSEWLDHPKAPGSIGLRRFFNQGSSTGGASIDWVIAGGESGHGFRPMRTEWAIELRDQCSRAGVPFFFKQWGGRTPKAGGRTLEGRTWDDFPLREFVSA
jgi:protein gp37